jgi:acid stress-induced BolA-like protein IbaG/YrbA
MPICEGDCGNAIVGSPTTVAAFPPSICLGECGLSAGGCSQAPAAAAINTMFEGGCGLDRARAGDSATPLLARVEGRLRASIDGVRRVEMVDVTDVDHVRQGSTDGRALAAHGVQLQLKIVATIFEGQRLLARHRLVNAALQELIASGAIHSVQIRALTPAAWAAEAETAATTQKTSDEA